MTYCPLGSLNGAIPKRKLFPDALYDNDAKPNDTEVFDDTRDTPENLTWKWLEDLAKACLLMQKGVNLRIDPIGPSINRVIVHRDIKPDNVFLDLPSELDGDWPAYPIATLGDFGAAIYTHDEDPENPMSYNYWTGTDGSRPVELATLLDGRTKRPLNKGRLGSPTNVWASDRRS